MTDRIPLIGMSSLFLELYCARSVMKGQMWSDNCQRRKGYGCSTASRYNHFEPKK